jgi:dihydrofolate synthase/folylpolyglutamate synthase
VAHNPQATAALAYNLDQMGFFPRTHAVFGAMRDKDIAGMVRRLLPLVDAWYLCDLPVARAASGAELARLVQQLAAPKSVSVSIHETPASALSSAQDAADLADRIVVFGSFLCVGGVLKDGTPSMRTRPTG